MKKSIFTIAFVAVAAISANAFNPILWHKTTGAINADKTVHAISADKTTGAISVDKTLSTAHPGKTVALEGGRKTVALQNNVAFESHGWL